MILKKLTVIILTGKGVLKTPNCHCEVSHTGHLNADSHHAYSYLAIFIYACLIRGNLTSPWHFTKLFCCHSNCHTGTQTFDWLFTKTMSSEDTPFFRPVFLLVVFWVKRLSPYMLCSLCTVKRQTDRLKGMLLNN